MSKKYHEAAFPHDPLAPQYGREGMELRDYFAAKVLQGLCANPDFTLEKSESMVKTAYECADLMMVERSKE